MYLDLLLNLIMAPLFSEFSWFSSTAARLTLCDIMLYSKTRLIIMADYFAASSESTQNIKWSIPRETSRILVYVQLCTPQLTYSYCCSVLLYDARFSVFKPLKKGPVDMKSLRYRED